MREGEEGEDERRDEESGEGVLFIEGEEGAGEGKEEEKGGFICKDKRRRGCMPHDIHIWVQSRIALQPPPTTKFTPTPLFYLRDSSNLLDFNQLTAYQR